MKDQPGFGRQLEEAARTHGFLKTVVAAVIVVLWNLVAWAARPLVTRIAKPPARKVPDALAQHHHMAAAITSRETPAAARLLKRADQLKPGRNPSPRPKPKTRPKVAAQLAGQILLFDYHDANGKASSRRVRVTHADATYIEGFCDAAQEIRTFRRDRIAGLIVSEDTGEIIEVGGRPSPPKPNSHGAKTEILFTGFKAATKEELERLATEHGFHVCKGVTRNLAYVCAGPTAGPSKLAKAAEVDAIQLDETGFRDLIAHCT